MSRYVYDFIEGNKDLKDLLGGKGANLAEMTRMGKMLGDAHDPLLLSVRSGGKFSMPGMMETILDIGLSDTSVTGPAKQSGDERFAWDSYRRLIQSRLEAGRAAVVAPSSDSR